MDITTTIQDFNLVGNPPLMQQMNVELQVFLCSLENFSIDLWFICLGKYLGIHSNWGPLIKEDNRVPGLGEGQNQ